MPELVLDGAGLDPRPGAASGARFMKKNLPVRAVRVALHHHRAVAQVRQQHGRDVGVVLEQVALGDAQLGPEQLAQVGERAPCGPPTRTSHCLPFRGMMPGVAAWATLGGAAGRAAPASRRADGWCGGLGAWPSRGALPAAGSSLGGRGCRGARRPAPARSRARAGPAARSISPPRLMSPRPTKSAGNSRRSPKMSASTSTYLPDGDAAQQHERVPGPAASSSARACSSSGPR